MAVSSDIQRAVEIIEQRIQSLQRIKEMLLQEFGIEEQVPGPTVTNIPSATPIAKPQPKKTRKESLIDFLKKRGPTTRGDILHFTDIPKGTIAFLLNDKKTFGQAPDGRWALREDMGISE